MEDMNGTISTFNELGAHDYDDLCARDYDMLAVVKDTTLRDVQNIVYEPRASSVEYQQTSNGLVAVSNYEEPILSQSQESVSVISFFCFVFTLSVYERVCCLEGVFLLRMCL